MPNIRKFTETHKYCSHCKTNLEFSKFSKDKTRSSGYRSLCKSCEGVKRNNNSEKYREISRRSYQKNKTKALLKSKKWTDANKNRHRALIKEWAKNNPERRRMHSAYRRGLKQNATPSWLSADHKQWIEWIYTQAKRLEDFTGIKHHVDHIIPLNHPEVCGLHVPWNLQILTAEENIRKRNKLCLD